MKASDIADIIEKYAPCELAYDWDNVGFSAGNREEEIGKIYLTLDCNAGAVREAVENGCNMIVSHHPLFFNPIKNICRENPKTELIRLLIKNDICVYSAHTNMDVAPCGINARLAKMFGLRNTGIIEPHANFENVGLGRYGDLDREMPLSEFVEMSGKILNTPLRFCGDKNTRIKRVGVASGACAELAAPSKALGCDVLVTADMKYHQMLDAADAGMCIVDAGHFPTEICVKYIFEEILKDTGLPLVMSTQKDVFQYN